MVIGILGCMAERLKD